MADTNKASATPAAGTGGSPTAPADAAAYNPAAPTGAETIDDFIDGPLARAAGKEAVPASNEAGKAHTPTEAGADAADAPDGADDADAHAESQPGGESAADPSAEDAAADEAAAAAAEADADEDADAADGGEAPGQLGQFAKGVLDVLQKQKVPDSIQTRVKQLFTRELKHKQTLSEKEAEIEELKTQLETAADSSTIVPAGPLAHLHTQEALDAEVADAIAYVKWQRQSPEDAVCELPSGRVLRMSDKDGQPDQEKMNRATAWFDAVLEHQQEQSRIIRTRAEKRATVRKTAPTLFDPKHEDGALFKRAYAADPRTWDDYDEFVADAIRGRRERMEEQKGLAKYPRVDLKKARENGALAHANGKNGSANGANGHGAAASNGTANGKGRTAYDLPLPKPPPRLPVMPANGADRKAQLREREQRGEPVTMDEMMDAGVM